MDRIRRIERLATRIALATAICSGSAILALAQDASLQTASVTKTSPNQMMDAMHQAFGAHHDRAVHTKGIMLLGTFTPDPAARTLTKAPIFAGGTLPVQARFSLFSGIPDIPDTDGGAAPTGLAIKIKAKNGASYDLASDQHNGFIVATVDEFAEVMRDVGASGPGVAHPTPIEQFIGTHPAAKAFVSSLTQPASYAQATFFGINAFKWTNAQGKSVFVRYRYVPRAGEHYLGKDELKGLGPNYLQDEIVARVAKEPVVFDWYVQIAEAGDKIEDPSAVWPESRKLMKIGTFTLTRQPTDIAAADKAFTVLPGSSHPGIDPADPMLTFRNKVYPVSFKARQ
ncbi:MAG TPA: catalase family peroxidase [Dongiaceae bacterium]|nr:catalase family peroxidase [Dongiaceae bacterium]